MANSTTNIDTIAQSQASKEVTANAYFDAASQAATYGRRASTSSGLTWGYYGGNVTRSDGTLVQVANGTLSLTANQTNYIVAAKATGAVSASTATTNWADTANYWCLYSVVAGASTVTSWADVREMGRFSGADGGGYAKSSGAKRADIALPASPTDGDELYYEASSGTIKTRTPSGGGFLSFTGEVSVTATTTLDSTAFGKSHVCSGTTVDYAVTLPAPAGNAGKLICLRMSDALTKLVTLDAGAGVLIDGQQTRVMWAGEVAWLLCTGTGWQKVAGKSRPMMTRMRYTNDTGLTISATTETVVPMSEVQYDEGGISNLANNQIVPRRTGRYIISGYFFHAVASATNRELGYLYINSTVAIMAEQYLGAVGNDGHIALSTPVSLSPGDLINLRIYSTQGGKNLRASSALGIYPYLAAYEVLSW